MRNHFTIETQETDVLVVRRCKYVKNYIINVLRTPENALLPLDGAFLVKLQFVPQA